MKKEAFAHRLWRAAPSMLRLVSDLADDPQTTPEMRQRAVEILARMTEGN